MAEAGSTAVVGMRPIGAAGLLVISVLGMSFQDMLVKLLSVDLSLWQFALMRASMSLPLIYLITRVRKRGSTIWPRNVRAVAIRTMFMLLALTCFFGSLSMFTMAQTAGGLYTAPLFVAVFSHFLLKEHVGPRRIVAVLIGFTGAMLILRPESSDAGWLIGLPILAGAVYACGLIATRRMCRDESAFALAAGTQFAYGVTGIIGCTALILFPPSPEIAAIVPFYFRPLIVPTAAAIGILAVIACINAFAHAGLSRAYQSAEASFLAPFDYSYLIFACVWGVMMWGDAVTWHTMAGIAMIAGGGIYIAWREGDDKRRSITR